MAPSQNELPLSERKAIGRDIVLTGLLLLAAAAVASGGSMLLSGHRGRGVGYIGLGLLGLVCLLGGAVQWRTGRGGFGRSPRGSFRHFIPVLLVGTLLLVVIPWLLDRLL